MVRPLGAERRKNMGPLRGASCIGQVHGGAVGCSGVLGVHGGCMGVHWLEHWGAWVLPLQQARWAGANPPWHCNALAGMLGLPGTRVGRHARPPLTWAINAAPAEGGSSTCANHQHNLSGSPSHAQAMLMHREQRPAQRTEAGPGKRG